MADKNIVGVVDSLLNGIDRYATAKTVVGEPIRVNDTILLPLVDVNIGMGAGAAVNGGKSKSLEGGGVGAKMSPSAVLVIRDGNTRLVSLKNVTTATKIMDMIPEIINRVTGKDKDADPEVQDKVDAMKEENK